VTSTEKTKDEILQRQKWGLSMLTKMWIKRWKEGGWFDVPPKDARDWIQWQNIQFNLGKRGISRSPSSFLQSPLSSFSKQWWPGSLQRLNNCTLTVNEYTICSRIEAYIQAVSPRKW
jgi:hypothetical protein